VIYIIREHAPEGQYFAPDAFAGNVGRTIRLTILTDELGATVTHAVILDAVVTPDQLAADITLEVGTWN